MTAYGGVQDAVKKALEALGKEGTDLGERIDNVELAIWHAVSRPGGRIRRWSGFIQDVAAYEQARRFSFSERLFRESLRFQLGGVASPPDGHKLLAGE